MFRRMIMVLFMMVACGCTDGWLSKPDGDDIHDLASDLRAMGPPSLMLVRNNKINDRLRRWATKHPDMTVGYFTCLGSEDGRAWPVHAPDLVALMLLLPDAGVDEIFDGLENALRPQVEEKLMQEHNFEPCDLQWFETDHIRPYVQAWLDGEMDDPDDTTDSARWLPTLSLGDIMSRPALMGALGVVVVGGVVMSGPAAPLLISLCALSQGRGWSCPGSPLYPPGQTQPGGDR